MKDCFTVIVSFMTEPDNQIEALEQIDRYIASFLSQQPGFISSRLHQALDGKGIVNYAQWETETDFTAFSQKARAHPDLPALMKYKPSAGFFSIWKQY